MKISIVTPCFNEEDSIELCVQKVSQLFSESLVDFELEHIICDNSSTDGTVEKLRNLAKDNDHLKVVVNSKNVGPFRNMWIGLKIASGDAVVPFLPADLQDPPEVIPEFVKLWLEGNLVVYGVRSNRQEGRFMSLMRTSYYSIISKFADFEIQQNAGEFLLADRKVIDSIISLDDEYPYIRGLIAQTGAKSTSVKYEWAIRKYGKSKLNFLQLADQAINGFVSTSRIPARLMLFMGFFIAFLGILGAIATTLLVIFSSKNITPGIPTIIVSLFLFGGMQMFFLGLIGEYVLSVHGQVRKSPKAFPIEKLNF